MSTWILSNLADFLVAERVADDISHEGLRALPGEEGISLSTAGNLESPKDPHFREKKARVERRYAVADRPAAPGAGGPEVVF